MKNILVTGCAGFIGFHVSRRLLEAGHRVAGFDNLNSYYDEGLKEARLARLRERDGFTFVKGDIAHAASVNELFKPRSFDCVVHLAAQPGVRHSLEEPQLYIQSNVLGFTNVIEAAHRRGTGHFVFASSSSVYGANTKIPFSETDNVDHPISVYGATKKADELLAYAYAHLYRFPVTGLRFFTVYGPWGRPDMALFKFCRAILDGTPIPAFNQGRMVRDFTYVEDAAECVARVVECSRAELPPAEAGAAPYRIYNVGSSHTIEIVELVKLLEHAIGRPAQVEWLPSQPGDVPRTFADNQNFFATFGYRPSTPIAEGVNRFVAWFREFYKK
ncbi:MAG TPA: SDR family NAD(P)-dependent oxidoreductase [Candidatus Angelobacter sp.]|nr:SDR family NAD(P)-dependent oxidoreductase [Candidatus Angelobacter sp.]